MGIKLANEALKISSLFSKLDAKALVMTND